MRMGGTVPFAELFQRHMQLDTVFFSFTTADEDYHADGERWFASGDDAGHGRIPRWGKLRYDDP